MNRTLRAFLLPLAAVILLPSCYDTGLIYPAGGYAAGYDDIGGYSPVGYNRPFYGSYGGFGGYPVNRGFGGGWGGWGGGFANRACCSRCGYNPCRCSGGHNHHHSGSSSRTSSGSSDRKYRILAGDLDGKKKPNDFHSLDWYHSRGYSLENVKMETDRGSVIDKRPSSQKSSSSASRSSSSNSSNNRSKASSNSSSRRSSSGSSSRSSSNSGNIREQIKAGLSKKK